MIIMYKPRTQKRIQNISRAINKLDKRLLNEMPNFQIRIEDVEPGINTVKYMQNGVRMEIRYSDLEKLGKEDQSALIHKLSVDRYKIQQQRAFEQLQTKGKISWQFKRSLEENAPELLKSIEKTEQQLIGNKADDIKNLFSDSNFEEDWEEDLDVYFNDPLLDTPDKYEFYYEFGFETMNQYTWNVYKKIKKEQLTGENWKSDPLWN